ncbi:MAG: mechanosensitive ion channel [Chitinophagaceae bacterium]|nr:mechanosensitive ion channel [Chitinophagaceae bacterium]
MKSTALIISTFVVLIQILPCAATAQVADSMKVKDSIIQYKDSGKANIDSVKKRMARQSKKEDQIRSTDTVVSYQLRKLREYSAIVNWISSRLRRGVDTIGLGEQITFLANNLEKARQGLLQDRSQNPNLRNLKSSLVLISGINMELTVLQKKMDDLNRETFDWRQKLSYLSGDTMMRKMPRDSALASEYLERIGEVIVKVTPAISQLENLALRLGVYQNQISSLLIESTGDIEEIEFLLGRFSKNMFSKEVPYLYQDYPGSKSLSEVLSLSFEKAWFTFRIYFQQSRHSRLWIVFLFLAIYFSGRWAMHVLDRQNKDAVLGLAGHWVLWPLLSSFFIALGFGQFFYVNAPAISSQSVWFLLLIIGTYLFLRNYEAVIQRFWIFSFVMVVFCYVENLTVQISQAERWIMIFMGLAGLLAAWLFYRNVVKKGTVELPFINILLILFVLQESSGILANVFGRYTLSKIMISGGYFNFINGVVLWWILLLLTEYVYLLFEALAKKESFTPYFDFIKYKEATRPFLVKVVIVLWVILFFKTLNLYDPIINWAEEILITERSIGDYTFTLRGILIFLFVLIVSSLIARLASFLLSPSKGNDHSLKRNNLGGMVLILKLVIYTLGFLLAIAAAGIPLDKITIIIGALGVGIGFGLQTIVNNLVSGIIIAFERPINVGDQIEVGGRLGKVMEIGIRSSKLATFDGAEVIIPNGDLLSQHLVNWTLSSNNRRIEIMVGVRYGTNLVQVKKLLEEILKGKEKIIPVPSPSVLLHEFGASSIDFRILFWTNDIDDWLNLKSKVIEEIDEVFKANGIEIPFPQQDIYIKEIKRD